MQITRYELFNVPPRWTFLKLETSDGIIGWGEPCLIGRYNAVNGAVEDLMNDYLLGESPLPIEDHWQQMYRHNFWRNDAVLMSAISGIDQALWDIKGKHFGAPVYELLGGPVREKIRLYQHIRAHRHTDDDRKLSPDAIADDAVAQVQKGFTALKMPPFERVERVDSPHTIKGACDRVGAVRNAVGDDIDIALDFHGRVSKPMAKRFVAELEQFDPMFYEEPLAPGLEDKYSELTKHTSIPLATGERIVSRWGFKQLFEDDSIDIVQPDTSHAGGITEVKKIADMAEAHDVAVAPHTPYGPMCLASALQVDGCAANVIIQEQLLHSEDHGEFNLLEYIKNPDVFDYDGNGYVKLPSEPGLGITIDEEVVRERSSESVDWTVPHWRHEDGVIAEW